jgi:hypothetical protein
VQLFQSVDIPVKNNMKTRITKTKATAKAKKNNPARETILNNQLSQTEPVYFWQAENDDGYLGQWYQSPFTWRKPIDGKDGEFEELLYHTAEQYVNTHSPHIIQHLKCLCTYVYSGI